MKAEYVEIFAILQDSERPRKERINAAETLGSTQDDALIPELTSFLKRPHPPEEVYIDFDPRIAERLVDIAVVGALNALGDDNHWNVLVNAVAEASGGIGQPPSEVELAGDVLGRIGSTELLSRIVDLCGESRWPAVANAVKTLVQTPLPEKCTHQNVHGIPVFTVSLELTVGTLSQYLEDFVQKSQGAVRLSTGLKNLLETNDYKVGNGQIENTSPAMVLTQILRLHNLAYYVEDNTATVCTFYEACGRWRNWWQENSSQLIHDKGSGRFLFKE